MCVYLKSSSPVGKLNTNTQVPRRHIIHTNKLIRGRLRVEHRNLIIFEFFQHTILQTKKEYLNMLCTQAVCQGEEQRSNAFSDTV